MDANTEKFVRIHRSSKRGSFLVLFTGQEINLGKTLLGENNVTFSAYDEDLGYSYKNLQI